MNNTVYDAFQSLFVCQRAPGASRERFFVFLEAGAPVRIKTGPLARLGPSSHKNPGQNDKNGSDKNPPKIGILDLTFSTINQGPYNTQPRHLHPGLLMRLLGVLNAYISQSFSSCRVNCVSSWQVPMTNHNSRQSPTQSPT
jgi:hypothetical protein